MAGEIKHSWAGTVLTITSDSGTSSCDLKGEKGDDGCRGAQGVAGAGLIDDTLSKKGFAADAQAMGEQFNLVNGRIDSIIALPDGATTADAELRDIRLDYKGRVRASAGDAVRNSFYEIDNRLKFEEAATEDIQGTQSQHEKRIINLEKRFANEPFIIDNSSDVSKIVPEGAMAYAAVNKVGGMSYKSKNLLNITPVNGAYAGITFTTNIEDGTITINGTATELVSIGLYTSTNEMVNSSFFRKGKTYTISDNTPAPNVNTYYTYCNIIGDSGEAKTVFGTHYSNSMTFTCEDTNISLISIQIVAKAGATLNNVVFKPQIEEGTQATSFEPYYSGLRNSYVSKLTSVGKNLFDKSKVYTSYVTETKTGFSFINTEVNHAPVTVGVLKNLAPFLKAGDTVTFYTDTVNSTKPDGFVFLAGSAFDWDSGVFHTITENELNGYVYAYGVLNELCEYNNFRITRIKDAPYEPYKENIFTIPTGAKGVGYGMGINESCYNYTDFERKVYIQNCVKVNLSTLEWVSGGNGLFYTHSLRGLGWGVIGDNEMSITLCSHYTADTKVNVAYETSHDKTISMVDNGFVRLRDNSYTDAASLKAALTDVFLIYPLATPIETDISDYIQDNFIEVAAGGVITAVNEYGYNVPTEYEYMIGG